MQGLTVKELDCVRGDRLVFAGVDLSVQPGRALLLSGANGSGKSSLLRIVAGLLPPAAGTLSWAGENIAADAEAHRRRIAYIGHADPVKPGLTVCENLEFWAQLYRLDTEIEPALYQFGIEQLADLPARYLSAGQRRRLTLARLAVGQNAPGGPPLWLLDEPATGLDPGAVALLANTLLAHLADDGVAVIASHGGLLDETLGAHADRFALQDTAT
jgi:heme exporter protein A